MQGCSGRSGEWKQNSASEISEEDKSWWEWQQEQEDQFLVVICSSGIFYRVEFRVRLQEYLVCVSAMQLTTILWTFALAAANSIHIPFFIPPPKISHPRDSIKTKPRPIDIYNLLFLPCVCCEELGHALNLNLLHNQMSIPLCLQMHVMTLYFWMKIFWYFGFRYFLSGLKENL